MQRKMAKKRTVTGAKGDRKIFSLGQITNTYTHDTQIKCWGGGSGVTD